MSRIESLLEQAARAVSGGGLHPLEVLQAVEAAALESVRDGLVANDFRVRFHPRDYERLTPALPELRLAMESLLDGLEERHRYGRAGGRRVGFEGWSGAAFGRPTVLARFVETEHRAPTSQTRGATKRIARHRGAVLVLGDGTRVRLTHTPFTIGRAAGNDLVLLSLAVSRQHAVIEADGERFLLRDLGSRNGLVVGGQRVEEAVLWPGQRMEIGDVQIALEDGRGRND
ncbi:MAG: DUF3662 domain-containing protein [Gemmataceae bacterium]|nr:DUF3662 domain-containing protein [Gemmataceae bacterium]